MIVIISNVVFDYLEFLLDEARIPWHQFDFEVSTILNLIFAYVEKGEVQTVRKSD
jgi:hypothetical protein